MPNMVYQAYGDQPKSHAITPWLSRSEKGGNVMLGRGNLKFYQTVRKRARNFVFMYYLSEHLVQGGRMGIEGDCRSVRATTATILSL